MRTAKWRHLGALLLWEKGAVAVDLGLLTEHFITILFGSIIINIIEEKVSVSTLVLVIWYYGK